MGVCAFLGDAQETMAEGSRPAAPIAKLPWMECFRNCLREREEGMAINFLKGKDYAPIDNFFRIFRKKR
jgi:hypothetical protein